MKVVLVSRYPRVDSMGWKRQVAEGLLDAGIELAVLFSRARLLDQARAGLREEGAAVARRYVALRRGEPHGASPGQSLASWAAAHAVPVVRVGSLSDPHALDALAAHHPDLLVLLGADIVPAPVLATPRIGTINAHYALLPAFRGMNVTEWSILAGAPVGVTIHLVDPGIDTGDILHRETIPIEAGDTLERLRRKHQQLAARLLVRATLELRDGRAQPTSQAPGEGRQYYRMHPHLRRMTERRLAQLAARV